jgi:hypothetical protein
MNNTIGPEWDDIKAIFTNPKTPYRLWTCPDPKLTNRQQKQRAEYGVATQFCEAIEAIEGKEIFKRTTKINTNDPPDIIIEKNDGSKIGLEVSELLDEEVQRARVETWRKEGRYYERKRWEQEELINKIQKRIEEKNVYNKPEFNGGPYDSKIFVIYSVDTSVSAYFRDLATIIYKREFGPVSRFDEIYFLTTPAPMRRNPQICKLRLKSSSDEN